MQDSQKEPFGKDSKIDESSAERFTINELRLKAQKAWSVLTFENVRFRAVWVSIEITVLIIAWLQIYFQRNQKYAEITFNFSSIVFSTLFWGSLYLAIGLGLTFTYKLLKFPNFAHGEYLVIGGYTAIFIQTVEPFRSVSTRGPDNQIDLTLFLAGILLGTITAAFAAIVIDALVFRPLRKKGATSQTLMISSLGVALFVRGLIFIRFGGGATRFIPEQDLGNAGFDIPTIRLRLKLGTSFGLEVPPARTATSLLFNIQILKLTLILLVSGLVLALMLFLKYTKQGKAIRAVSDNPDLAAASGINVERVYQYSWIIGGGLAGAAGAVLSAAISFTPETGFIYLLPAFAVIVLGSIGSVGGAVIAALIIGFARAISEPITSGLGDPLNRPAMSAYRDIVPFLFLIVILLFYSEGIGLKLERWRIEKMRENMEEEENNTAKEEQEVEQK